MRYNLGSDATYILKVESSNFQKIQIFKFSKIVKLEKTRRGDELVNKFKIFAFVAVLVAVVVAVVVTTLPPFTPTATAMM